MLRVWWHPGGSFELWKHYLVISGRGARGRRAGEIQGLRRQEHGERKRQFSRRASNGTWAEWRAEGEFLLGVRHCHPSGSGCREPEQKVLRMLGGLQGMSLTRNPRFCVF